MTEPEIAASNRDALPAVFYSMQTLCDIAGFFVAQMKSVTRQIALDSCSTFAAVLGGFHVKLDGRLYLPWA